MRFLFNFSETEQRKTFCKIFKNQLIFCDWILSNALHLLHRYYGKSSHCACYMGHKIIRKIKIKSSYFCLFLASMDDSHCCHMSFGPIWSVIKFTPWVAFIVFNSDVNLHPFLCLKTSGCGCYKSNIIFTCDWVMEIWHEISAQETRISCRCNYHF